MDSCNTYLLSMYSLPVILLDVRIKHYWIKLLVLPVVSYLSLGEVFELQLTCLQNGRSNAYLYMVIVEIRVSVHYSS